MASTHQVVHVTSNRGEAHALKNLLAGYGIAAHVDNDFASGDLYVGTPTADRNLPRVVVPEQDVEQARQIIAEAAWAAEQGLPSPELARLEAESGADDDWPACPHCGRGRLTSCPVCETSGTHFAEAFMPDLGPDNRRRGEPDDDALWVLCPTCDEPFAPRFPARCEWCGHRFRDGYEPPPIEPDPLAQFAAVDIGSRALIAAAGLVAFVAALFGWFYYVLR